MNLFCKVKFYIQVFLMVMYLERECDKWSNTNVTVLFTRHKTNMKNLHN